LIRILDPPYCDNPAIHLIAMHGECHAAIDASLLLPYDSSAIQLWVIEHVVPALRAFHCEHGGVIGTAFLTARGGCPVRLHNERYIPPKST
jgi:hypothetical protein